MVGENGKFFIKQFGLQRSGTNAVKALLEVNFPEIRVLTTFLVTSTNQQTINLYSTNLTTRISENMT